MDQPVATRRRFRFGLRTLLAVVTFAAVGSWMYWIGWPWWTNLCEQSEFLAAVRQIKAGSPTVPMEKLAPGGNHRMRKSNCEVALLENEKSLYSYFWENATYCVLVKSTPSRERFLAPDLAASRVSLLAGKSAYEVASIAPPKQSKIICIEAFRLAQTTPKLSEITYQFELLHHLLSDRKNIPGFEYELIYSDPPATPAVK